MNRPAPVRNRDCTRALFPHQTTMKPRRIRGEQTCCNVEPSPFSRSKIRPLNGPGPRGGERFEAQQGRLPDSSTMSPDAVPNPQSPIRNPQSLRPTTASLNGFNQKRKRPALPVP